MKIFMPSVHPRRTKGVAESLRIVGGELILCGRTFAFPVGGNKAYDDAAAKREFGPNVSVYEGEEIFESPPDVMIVGAETAERDMAALHNRLRARHPIALCFYSGNFHSAFTWSLYDGGICTDRATEIVAKYHRVPIYRYRPMLQFDALPFRETIPSKTVYFRSFINKFEDRYPFAYKFMLQTQARYASRPDIVIENVEGLPLAKAFDRMAATTATLHIKDQEGFGWSILESMAIGRPVILQRGLARNMALEDWSIEGETAYYFDTYDDLDRLIERFKDLDFTAEAHRRAASGVRRIYDPVPSARGLLRFLSNISEYSSLRWVPGVGRQGFLTNITRHKPKLDPLRSDAFEILLGAKESDTLFASPSLFERNYALAVSSSEIVFGAAPEGQFYFYGPNLSLAPGNYEAEFLVDGGVSCDVFAGGEKVIAGQDHRAKFVVAQAGGKYEFRGRSTGGEAKVAFRGVNIRRLN